MRLSYEVLFDAYYLFKYVDFRAEITTSSLQVLTEIRLYFISGDKIFWSSQMGLDHSSQNESIRITKASLIVELTPENLMFEAVSEIRIKEGENEFTVATEWVSFHYNSTITSKPVSSNPLLFLCFHALFLPTGVCTAVQQPCKMFLCTPLFELKASLIICASHFIQ